MEEGGEGVVGKKLGGRPAILWTLGGWRCSRVRDGDGGRRHQNRGFGEGITLALYSTKP